jgi:hypothetical protein
MLFCRHFEVNPTICWVRSYTTYLSEWAKKERRIDFTADLAEESV